MSGGGTGSPIWFVCSVCRGKRDPYHRFTFDSGRIDRVRLTGRIKKHDPNGARGCRNDLFKREYLCLDCNHIGWSSHRDLAHLPTTVETSP